MNATAPKLTATEGPTMFESDENPTEETSNDMVKLAQDQKRFKKKVADLEDKIIESDDAIEAARSTLRDAIGLDDCKEALKTWEKAQNGRDRLVKNINSYRDMLTGVTKKMQEALNA